MKRSIRQPWRVFWLPQRGSLRGRGCGRAVDEVEQDRFVAAKPVALVLNNIKSFTLGAKKTNPQAVVQVIFTGEWSLPVREAEAAKAFADAGCDVVTCHVDGPKVVIETAEKRG